MKKLIIASLLVTSILTGCNTTTSELNVDLDSLEGIGSKSDKLTQEKRFEIMQEEAEEARRVEKRQVPNVSYVTDDGSFRIGQTGVLRVEGGATAPITTHLIFDPACPATLRYLINTLPEMSSLISQGEIELIIKPVPYLNDTTAADYSSRASAYILASAEYAPTKTLQFLSNLLTERFAPRNSEDVVQDSDFLALMRSSGFSESEINAIDKNKEFFVSRATLAAEEFVSEDSQYLQFSTFKQTITKLVEDENNPEGYEIEEEGPISVYTPFVLINKTGELKQDALVFGQFYDLQALVNDFVKRVYDLKEEIEEEASE